MIDPAFSLASWNVRSLRGARGGPRVRRVLKYSAAHDPDVLALHEVLGRDVFDDLFELLPGHHFQITEGRNAMEIVVGVRAGLTSFLTQKLEFKADRPHLRPGALVTVRAGGADYTVLFLHTKSGDDPEGFGLRDAMFERVMSLQRRLDAAAAARAPGARANLLVVGDLNTMGLRYAHAPRLLPETELRHLADRARHGGLRFAAPTHPSTWWNGRSRPGPAPLDHVLAADHLALRAPGAPAAEVRVQGWPELASPAERREWIARYSDHALLLCEVLPVAAGTSRPRPEGAGQEGAGQERAPARPPAPGAPAAEAPGR